MVKVLSEEIKPSATAGSFAVAVVKTDVNHKGEIFPIHYKLVEKSGTWKVYDIVIENIGLVSNYRSEFAGVLRKTGFDGLIEKLKAKEKKE
jgi:phospholipid transport system substrate-binding protein